MKSQWKRLRAVQSAISPQRNALVWLELFRDNSPLPASFWQFSGSAKVGPLVDRLLSAHIVLGLWVANITGLTGRLQDGLRGLQTLSAWQSDVRAILNSAPANVDSVGIEVAGRLDRRQQQLAEWSAAERARLGTQWSEIWEMLRIAERAAATISDEFSGQDILIPELRAEVDRCRGTLESLGRELRMLGAKLKRFTPSARTVESLVAWIDGGRDR